MYKLSLCRRLYLTVCAHIFSQPRNIWGCYSGCRGRFLVYMTLMYRAWAAVVILGGGQHAYRQKLSKTVVSNYQSRKIVQRWMVHSKPTALTALPSVRPYSRMHHSIFHVIQHRVLILQLNLIDQLPLFDKIWHGLRRAQMYISSRYLVHRRRSALHVLIGKVPCIKKP